MTTDRAEIFEQKIKKLSREIMFSSVSESDIISSGLCYRKGKTFSDLKAAVKRGVKQGVGKTECELSMVEVQIKSVLKMTNG